MKVLAEPLRDVKPAGRPALTPYARVLFLPFDVMLQFRDRVGA